MESRKVVWHTAKRLTALFAIAVSLIMTGCEYFHNPFLDSLIMNGYLLINGDFESGNTGFGSEMVYNGSGLGNYYITRDPYSLWNLWFSFYDHTSSSGNMLVVDGRAGVAWSQTINVIRNGRYTFRGYTANCDSGSQAPISIEINDVPVLAFIASSSATWSEFEVAWDSGAATTAKIEIIDTSDAFTGNDFAIDDLSFQMMQ